MNTDRFKFSRTCDALFVELCQTVHDFMDTRMAKCSERAKESVCISACAALAASAAKAKCLDLDSLVRIITVFYSSNDLPLPNPDDVVVDKDPE